MRTTLRHTLAACIALSALMLTGTACTDHDDLRTPAGTQLLQLGEVTVQGTETATTRSAATTGSATRALIEDGKGFTGIRKTTFKAGDVLALTLSNGSTANATLGNDDAWTLDTRTYYAAGTELTATYTPGGINHTDVLTVSTNNLPEDGNPLALALTHANALIEVTPPAEATGSNYTITVAATPASTSQSEVLKTDREEDTTPADPRYRTIALPGTVESITLTANGMTYTATLNSLQVEANKRYPIALSVKDNQLNATVNTTGGLDWGTGGTSSGEPMGYDHYIATAEDLAQYAKDMEASSSNTTALQMADIDLGTLRPAAEANTYYGTNKYNYTVTKDNWMPIANGNFSGNYNGNGHTISNLKITQTGTQTGSGFPRLGLFRTLVNAKVTGVHLRNCQITSSGVTIEAAGALAAYAGGSTVTLCSATGSVSVDVSHLTSITYGYVGGLIGWCNDGDSSNNIDRCSADVAVSLNSKSSGYCGAFVGLSKNTVYAACIASGTVTKMGTVGTFSGFSSQEDGADNRYKAYSCITNSEIVKTDGSDTSAFGRCSSLSSCLATQPKYTNFGLKGTDGSDPENCVCLGAATSELSGVSYNITADKAYEPLTKRSPTSTNIKTLYWSKKDGYTLTEVRYSMPGTGVWKKSPNGLALPTLDMSYEGIVLQP